MDRREQYDRLDRDHLNRHRHKTLRIVLLKVLLPLMIVGSSVAVLIVLHLDGTLREFLDRQSMFGMIAVVLVLNIFGFASIYMLIIVHLHAGHRMEFNQARPAAPLRSLIHFETITDSVNWRV